jgi:hypothetical protein
LQQKSSNPSEADVKRIHHYHADGSALGGFITLPKSSFVPSQAEVSLAPAGGATSDKAGRLDFEDIVACSSSETHATGSVHPKSGAWSTLVTTIVDNLNIRNAVTAERVVAQISVEHPRDGYTPKVTFVGSQFIGLRIGGVPVEPVINYKILTPAEDFPPVPWTRNQEFHDTIREQKRNRSKDAPVPPWASEFLGDGDPMDGFDEKGYFLCSLVDKIEGKFPGESCGHLVKIPDVGKFIFGEVSVDHGSFRLVMVRAELGSPVTGSISAAASRTNGVGGP